MRFLLPWALASSTVSAYTWKNVKIGGGGGFTPGIVFNPTKQGVAYARTDIGGLYRLNSDDSWTPLTDFADSNSWHDWGVWSVATDPVATSNVYAAVGMYTNSWDPNVGSILRSTDQGTTWAETKLPFKLPGNQPGRGLGERLVVDPANNKVLFFGAPSGNGLYKSTDQGVTWTKVSTFTAVGDFQEDATDTTGYQSDFTGLTSIVFDTTSGTTGGATSRIFVGTATITGSSVWVSNDAGATWTAIAGQPIGRFPHRMKFSSAEKLLYITFGKTAGPYDAGDGTVYKYSTTSSTWTNITPAWEASNSLTFGYGGLALDAKVPGTLMVAADNLWWPDVQIFRSTDSGTTWTNIWDWNDNHYTYNTNKAPWINASRGSTDTKVLGWMVESLEIDPFDSNHWLYGTGLTVYGGHDLTSWPAVTVQSLADGIEETSVQALISIPGGTPLLSAVGDDGGFVHKSLDVSPSVAFINPSYATVRDLDFAGQKVANIVIVGNDGSAGLSQLATSTNGGATWTAMTLSSNSSYGGKVAYSADGTTIVWATASTGGYRFVNGVQSTITLATGVVLAADKINAKYFYAADQNSVYVSSDGGATFTTTALSSGGANSIEVNPSVAGDVWLGGSSGLWHSVDFGKTWTKSASVTTAYAIAIGKGTGSYPNVYGFVTTSSASTLQVSADQGGTWTVISDAQHGFGAGSANCLAASMDTAGLVFVGTNGRGIFYGNSGTSSSTTTTSKASSATSTTSKASSTTVSTSKASTSTSTTLATSTTKSVTSTTSKTSTSATATATGVVVGKWGQCGGTGWTGGTVCVSGSTCTFQNAYYSQCL